MSDEIKVGSVLAEVHRQSVIKKDFSKDNNERNIEKSQLMNLLTEPIRRLEFNVILNICESKYKPYENIRHTSDFSISIQKDYLADILSVLDSENSKYVNLLTIDFKNNKTRFEFFIKDSFKNFNDIMYIKRDNLYHKLFSLGINSNIKTLYYFLTKYKYDFLSIVEKYNRIYNELINLDNYFDKFGNYKRLINLEVLDQL